MQLQRKSCFITLVSKGLFVGIVLSLISLSSLADPSAPVVMTSKVLGWSPFSKQDAKPKLYVTVADNAALASIMTEPLENQGFVVVDDEAKADYNLELDAEFAFDKRGSKRQSVSVGKLLADPRMESALATLDSQATRGTSLTSTNLNIAVAHLRDKISTATALGLTIVDVLLDLSGLGGAFNKLLVGDERGLCIPLRPGACANWNVYNQRLALKAKVSNANGSLGEVLINTSTQHERLAPLELLVESQTQLASVLVP